MEGLTRIAIVSEAVLGIEAFYASCLECDWRCHRKPHESEATAVRCAGRHVCKES